jgi:predicted RNA binding protein YcfA (HicA-like mRNA interferase family)
MQFPSAKARRVLAALERLGWQVKRQSGSHRTLAMPDKPDYIFAFHDGDEIGPEDVGSHSETHRPEIR